MKMMNSRQKRKARYAETHEAPIKTKWIKTTEFGKIGECNSDSKYYQQMKKNQLKMRMLKNELISMGLWNKHTGSSKHTKLRGLLRKNVTIYSMYKSLINDAAKHAEIPTPEVVRTGYMQADLPESNPETYEIINETN